MQRWGIIVAGAVVFVLVASQVLVPSLAAREVESRLTEGGGSADVTLGAVPALRLLVGDGERFEVEARDLELELDQEVEVFDRLDGFGIVEISLTDSRAGPIELSTFELTRDGSGPYTLSSVGEASPADLVDFGIDDLDLPGGGLVGQALDTLFGTSDVALPIELEMQVASKDGRVEVIEGDAEVAGVPAGPLAEMIAATVVSRL
jgi:hypothetical protein